MLARVCLCCATLFRWNNRRSAALDRRSTGLADLKRRPLMKSLIAFTLAAALSGVALAQQQPRTDTPPPESTAPPASTSQQTQSSTARTAQLGAIFVQLNTSHTGK